MAGEAQNEIGVVQSFSGAIARLAPYVPLLSRYTVASVLALALDLTVLLALRHIGLSATAAGVGGYTAGLILQFVLAQRLVFTDTQTRKTEARLFAEFAASGLVGLAITAGIMHVATDMAGLPALVGKLLAVAASFVAVFLLRQGVVFKDRSAAA